MSKANDSHTAHCCFCRYLVKQHTCLNLHADAQLGGPLYIRISQGKEQPTVPLAAKTSAILRFNDNLAGHSQAGHMGKGFELQRQQLSDTQQAPETWLHVILLLHHFSYLSKLRAENLQEQSYSCAAILWNHPCLTS